MTYAFEAMRSVVIEGYLPKNYLVISFLLTSLFGTGRITFLVYA